MGVEGTNLIVRKDGVLCTVCGEIEPVHPGESGTPLASLLIGYKGVIRRHPPERHERQLPGADGSRRPLLMGRKRR
jgi:hypothetical protein